MTNKYFSNKEKAQIHVLRLQQLYDTEDSP
jgi:hypothetical protein